MKRIDVINNIEGSRLKKQFLEAFLLQSAFIESLLKKLAEDDLLINVTYKVILPELRKGNFNFNSKQLDIIKDSLLRQNQYELIEYLFKVDIIDKELRQNLHKYRENRNSILHDLVKEISDSGFEDRLQKLVTLGQEILSSNKMVEASEAIQKMEDLTEVIDSNDPEKIKHFLEEPKNVPIQALS